MIAEKVCLPASRRLSRENKDWTSEAEDEREAEQLSQEKPLRLVVWSVCYFLIDFWNIASTRAAESSTRFAAASARPAAASARLAAASARLAEVFACVAAAVQVSLISGCFAAHPRLIIVSNAPAAIPVAIRPEAHIVLTPFLSILAVHVAIIT